MDLSEFLHKLNFPADLRRYVVLVQLRENSSSWPLILEKRSVSEEETGRFFDPSTIAALEKRLGLSFEMEVILNGKVCYANSEEVRPDFRTTFSAKELLDYILALLSASGSELKAQEEIFLSFPESPAQFWELVKLGEKRRVSSKY